MPRTGFLFTLDTFGSAEGIATLRPSFARLPLDPYIEGHFRRRRYSHFSGRPQTLRRLEHQTFQQSRDVNHLLGGVRREYEELEDEVVANEAFRAMIATYIEHLGIDPSVSDFGVHQIRILCSPGFAGDPAPEGIHQDGFDYVGIFCIDRVNVAGAATHLYKAKDLPPIFNKELQPGEVVFVNDREVFHYTDPLHPRAPGDGHRDVFVITA